MHLLKTTTCLHVELGWAERTDYAVVTMYGIMYIVKCKLCAFLSPDAYFYVYL